MGPTCVTHPVEPHLKPCQNPLEAHMGKHRWRTYLQPKVNPYGAHMDMLAGQFRQTIIIQKSYMYVNLDCKNMYDSLDILKYVSLETEQKLPVHLISAGSEHHILKSQLQHMLCQKQATTLISHHIL